VLEVDATERSWSGVMLPWVTKPERSCRAITLMTMVAFVTTVFVHQVDVTRADWQIPFVTSAGATSEVLECTETLFGGGGRGASLCGP
jgi:hypothetical protein